MTKEHNRYQHLISTCTHTKVKTHTKYAYAYVHVIYIHKHTLHKELSDHYWWAEFLYMDQKKKEKNYSDWFVSTWQKPGIIWEKIITAEPLTS